MLLELRAIFAASVLDALVGMVDEAWSRSTMGKRTLQGLESVR
jgi:hypothetical protein